MMFFHQPQLLIVATLLSFGLAQEKTTSERLCGTKETAACPLNQVCVKPAPTVRCSPKGFPETCPGTCKPRCVVGEPKSSCPLGQKCAFVPYSKDKSLLGYCPDPASCGGLANIRCEDPDEVCVDNPRDHCDPNKGGADCSGTCILNPKGYPTDQSCGGKMGKKCRDGYKCVDNPKDDCNPAKGGKDCPGLCVKQDPSELVCGTRGGFKCPKDYQCIRDPECDPKTTADCPGHCRKKIICGTLRGLQCPKGEKCVDDPDNGCSGGIAADCPGMCIQP